MVQSKRDWVKVASLFVAALFVATGLVAGGLQAQASIDTGVVAQNPAMKIDSQVLKDTVNGQKTSFVIMLSSQADVSAANSMKDQDARGWYVYRTLTEFADRTQAPLRGLLTAQGVQFQVVLGGEYDHRYGRSATWLICWRLALTWPGSTRTIHRTGLRPLRSPISRRRMCRPRPTQSSGA